MSEVYKRLLTSLKSWMFLRKEHRMGKKLLRRTILHGVMIRAVRRLTCQVAFLLGMVGCREPRLKMDASVSHFTIPCSATLFRPELNFALHFTAADDHFSVLNLTQG